MIEPASCARHASPPIARHGASLAMKAMQSMEGGSMGSKQSGSMNQDSMRNDSIAAGAGPIS